MSKLSTSLWRDSLGSGHAEQLRIEVFRGKPTFSILIGACLAKQIFNALDHLPLWSASEIEVRWIQWLGGEILLFAKTFQPFLDNGSDFRTNNHAHVRYPLQQL
jgi:hypothetical protein